MAGAALGSLLLQCTAQGANSRGRIFLGIFAQGYAQASFWPLRLAMAAVRQGFWSPGSLVSRVCHMSLSLSGPGKHGNAVHLAINAFPGVYDTLHYIYITFHYITLHYMVLSSLLPPACLGAANGKHL